MIEPYYDRGGITIYHGDCAEVMNQLGEFDLLLTDPPYGIGERLVKGGKGGSFDMLINSGANLWDTKISEQLMGRLFEVTENQIIWGGNFYKLPPCNQPLCWDKVRPNQRNLSEFEYCWTSFTGRARMFRFCANGGFVSKEHRYHPTQKPLQLMQWCLSIDTDSETVLDPFMGSGTTLVACKLAGISCVGIEREESYCEAAVKRLAQEVLF